MGGISHLSHLDGGGLGLPRAVGAHDVHVQRVRACLGGREGTAGLAGVGARREDRGAPLTLSPGAGELPDVVVFEAGGASRNVGGEGHGTASGGRCGGDGDAVIDVSILHLNGGGLGRSRSVGIHDVNVEVVGAGLGGRERARGRRGVRARREDRGAPLALLPGALVGPDVVVRETGGLAHNVG